MEFTKQDLGLINDLCSVAWSTGQVKSPQMAQTIETLRMKIQHELTPVEQRGPKALPPPLEKKAK